MDQTNGVFGLCYDDERKRILVCDCNNQRVSVWSVDGSQFLHVINMPNKQYPMSVCVDRFLHPHYFVVGTKQSQILVFDARNETKQMVQTIGSKGSQPGQFYSSIHGVCVRDDGALLATDDSNYRVQIF